MGYLIADEFRDDGTDREHCYKIAPVFDGEKLVVNDSEWKNIHGILGKLGYRFRDAVFNFNFAYVSLNKGITSEHLSQLEKTLSIAEDDGAELGWV